MNPAPTIQYVTVLSDTIKMLSWGVVLQVAVAIAIAPWLRTAVEWVLSSTLMVVAKAFAAATAKKD